MDDKKGRRRKGENGWRIRGEGNGGRKGWREGVEDKKEGRDREGVEGGVKKGQGWVTGPLISAKLVKVVVTCMGEALVVTPCTLLEYASFYLDIFSFFIFSWLLLFFTFVFYYIT